LLGFLAACVGSDPTSSTPAPDGGGPSGDDGGTASDSGPSGFAVGGNIHFLQAGSGVTLALNGAPFAVAKNGAFAAPTRLASGDAYNVTVTTQPAGQTCWTENGAGTVGGSDVASIVVRCTVALHRASGIFGGPDVSLPAGVLTPTYATLDAIAPITFVSDVPSKALVTFHVPLAGPKPQAQFATVIFRVDIDDKVVGYALNKANYPGRPGPVGFVSMIDVPAGSHTVSVHWTHSGNSGVTTLYGAAPTNLTVTLLESLSIHRETVIASSTMSGVELRDTNPRRYGVPDVVVTPAAASPVLVTSTIPAPYGDFMTARSDVDVASLIGDGGLDDAAPPPLANAFVHGQEQTTSLMAIPTLAGGPHTLSALWSGYGSAGNGGQISVGEGGLVATLGATVFAPSAVVAFTSRDLPDTESTSTTLVDIPNVAVSLNVPRAGKLLAFLQPNAAAVINVSGTDEYRGEIALALDGTVVASSYVASDGDNYQHEPLLVATMLDVTQGPHTLAAQYRTTGAASPVRIHAGKSNIGGILLE
jgi:hypothetical protein